MRIALLSYRSKDHCGGQGVYVRNLSRELVALGHEVVVFSGQPYPTLDDGVQLEKVPSLDLYNDNHPFQTPHYSQIRDVLDLRELVEMWTAGFGETITFSQRMAARFTTRPSAHSALGVVSRALRGSVVGEKLHGFQAAATIAEDFKFDVVHDNQCIGPGLLDIQAAGIPLVTTIHHPISKDRVVALADAVWWRKPMVARWFGFVSVQKRVAAQLRHIITVSGSSAQDIVSDFEVDESAIEITPLGVDTELFSPDAAITTANEMVCIASADQPLKGVDVLLAALAIVKETRPNFHLTLITKLADNSSIPTQIQRLGLAENITITTGLSHREIAVLLSAAQISIIPSRYEGFSLPAVEALSSGTAVIATEVGALPEVVGTDGSCAQLVPSDNPQALAEKITALLADKVRCDQMGAAGRQRAEDRFSWSAVARATVAVYEQAIFGDEPRRCESDEVSGTTETLDTAPSLSTPHV